jgi:hypothetical protein
MSGMILLAILLIIFNLIISKKLKKTQVKPSLFRNVVTGCAYVFLLL